MTGEGGSISKGIGNGSLSPNILTLGVVYEYINSKATVTDINYVFSLIDRKSFIEFNNEKNEDLCLDIGEIQFRINDDEARAIIKQTLLNWGIADIQVFCIKDRNEFLRE